MKICKSALWQEITKFWVIVPHVRFAARWQERALLERERQLIKNEKEKKREAKDKIKEKGNLANLRWEFIKENKSIRKWENKKENKNSTKKEIILFLLVAFLV